MANGSFFPAAAGSAPPTGLDCGTKASCLDGSAAAGGGLPWLCWLSSVSPSISVMSPKTVSRVAISSGSHLRKQRLLLMSLCFKNRRWDKPIRIHSSHASAKSCWFFFPVFTPDLLSCNFSKASLCFLDGITALGAKARYLRHKLLRRHNHAGLGAVFQFMLAGGCKCACSPLLPASSKNASTH